MDYYELDDSTEIQNLESNITNCVICQENSTVMKLTHTCGNWYIHDECLSDWFTLHPNECFICREKYTNTDSKLITNIGADLSYILVKNDNAENKLSKLYYCYYSIPFLCLFLGINLTILFIMTLYRNINNYI